MSKGRAAAILGLLALAGCAELGAPLGAAGTGVAIPVATSGPLAATGAGTGALTGTPFAAGPVAVVAAAPGEVEAWSFVPCQGGAAVCFGALDGPASAVSVVPGGYLVTGPGGLVFRLDRGGDGRVEAGGTTVPLAWNATGVGTGPGTEASLDQPVPHGGPTRTQARR